MLLDDIKDYLEQNSIGTFGADLFIGQLPPSPDDCIALFEYAGEPPDLHWNGEYPGLQVMARGKSYPATRAKIESVKNILHGVTEKVINGTRYLLIQARQSPATLGRDENGRQLFVVNFRIIKEVS
jgi:hypothetical protein